MGMAQIGGQRKQLSADLFAGAGTGLQRAGGISVPIMPRAA
jgi:hypothetical protein